MRRLSLRALLEGTGESVVRECLSRWCGGNSAASGRSAVRSVAAAIEDEQRVLARMANLPRKQQDLLEAFLGDGGPVRSVHSLFTDLGGNFKSRFDLEATLAALHREAFVWPVKDKRWASFDSPCWAAPSELVECVQECRRRRQRQLQDSLTLQGFLDARFFRQRIEGAKKSTSGGNGKPTAAKGSDANAAKATEQKSPEQKGPEQKSPEQKSPEQKSTEQKAAEHKAASHARKIYKLYTLESSMAQRLQKLPPNVGALVFANLQRHGGIAVWDELLREMELQDAPDLAFVGKSLEEAMLGTTGPLDLARLGIQPAERTMLVFHEVALYAIRRRGEQNRPPIAEELSCGGDLPTNVGRFLRELQQSKVLFTAEGDLFKASQKRIAGLLLPMPGGFLDPEALLELIFRFCLHRRLIDRRGERSLRPTPAGLEFDRAPLAQQVKMLLAHFVEDRTLPGESYHQTRMRRVLLRLLRRAEPMLWQDVAVLPFLTRNAYLAQIDTQQTEEFFAARFQGGGYTPSETLQQMCWNLLVWIKKRLFPLGVVDIGMHGGRVTALRLSKLGTELLDAEPAGKVGGTRSSVIVQPDFEILVFPGDDVHDVVHLFDRFAHRTKSDHVHQFQLDQTSLQAGLADGLSAVQIVQELTDRARVPIPQNVLYSIDEWAQKPPA
ncbi:MAG: helicase-associated domain-containing protein [Planctomycetota bacterium]